MLEASGHRAFGIQIEGYACQVGSNPPCHLPYTCVLNQFPNQPQHWDPPPALSLLLCQSREGYKRFMRPFGIYDCSKIGFDFLIKGKIPEEILSDEI